MQSLRIAIVGWGSLVWDPRKLRLKSHWYLDGPELPIEFARISGGDRLTLVILPGCTKQTTLWAVSTLTTLSAARINLQKREGTLRLKPIHYMERDGPYHPEMKQEERTTIEEWIHNQPSIDAVVWTSLRSNWTEKRGKTFSHNDAIAYLKELRDSTRAEEYIRKAPAVTCTDLRHRIEREIGWAAKP